MTDRHPALVAFDRSDDFTRAKAILDLYGRHDLMPRREWFVQLGLGWTNCANIGQYRERLSRILNDASRGELDLMMTAEERKAWALLPETIGVQRGCCQFNERGLSWTRVNAVACLFASIYVGNKHGDVPLILTGYANKARAVLKNPHGHQEIISTNVQIVKKDVYTGAPFRSAGKIINARVPDSHPALVAIRNAAPDSRAKTILDLYGKHDVIPRREWFVQLGRNWSYCSNIGQYRERLSRILNDASRDELDLMMTAEERAVLSASPPLLIAYRGCCQFNERGLSWTASSHIAGRYASINVGIPGHTPQILTGYVDKKRCVFKRDRGSEEIISTNVQVVRRDVYTGPAFGEGNQ